MLSYSVKVSSQKTFEKFKISHSQFNFLKWHEHQYINYIENPVGVACQSSLMLILFQFFSVSLFSFGAVC